MKASSALGSENSITVILFASGSLTHRILEGGLVFADQPSSVRALRRAARTWRGGRRTSLGSRIYTWSCGVFRDEPPWLPLNATASNASRARPYPGVKPGGIGAQAHICRRA